MATKYQFITGVYESTIGRVTETPANWTVFLHKIEIPEQLTAFIENRSEQRNVLERERGSVYNRMLVSRQL